MCRAQQEGMQCVAKYGIFETAVQAVIMVGKQSGAQSSVAQELENARRELLDRTLRNRLLNFRAKSKIAIPVIEEVPREVYGRLVLDGKSMVLRGRPARNQTDNLNGGSRVSGEPGESDSPVLDSQDSAKTNEKELWRLDDEQLGKQHTDKYLETSLTELELHNRLFKIYHKANEVMEEQGYNVLYLALAFLEWKQKEDEERTYLAPMILVPIELKRHTAGKRYSLSWSGEEVFTNISLAARLKEDFGIVIPEFSMPDDKSGVKQYLDKVSKAIKAKESWRVTSGIWLGFFSFARFVMWRDLASESWPGGNKPEDCSLLSKLFSMEGGEPEQLDGIDDEALVSKLDIRDTTHVMDADASQVAVIEHTKAGKNMVVEGPPGTGKSQTITNLIAELLASGKKVLFVSEKMAALDVVYRRLKKCGLADACLELHSHKTNKKLFYEEISRTINHGMPGQPQLESEYQRYAQLKEELDGYASALGKEYGKVRYSAFKLFGMREKSNAYFNDKQADVPRIAFKFAEDWPAEEYSLARRQLRDIADLLPKLQPIKGNPWYACAPEAYTQSDAQDLLDQISETKVSIEQVQAVIQELATVTGATKALSAEQVDDMREAVDMVAFAPDCAKQALFKRADGSSGTAGQQETNDVLAVLARANEKWSDRLLQRIKSAQDARKALAAKLNASVLDSDVAGLLNEYNQQRSSENLSGDFVSFTNTQNQQTEQHEKSKVAKQICEILTHRDAQNLFDQINRNQDAIHQVQSVIQELSAITGANEALSSDQVASMREAVGVIAFAPVWGKQFLQNSKDYSDKNSVQNEAKKVLEILALVSNQWADDLLQRVGDAQIARRVLACKLNADVLDSNVETLLMEFEQLRGGAVRLLKLGYWKTRNHILSFYKAKQKRSDEDLVADLQGIVDLQHLTAKLFEVEEVARKVCGNLWQGLETDCDSLRRTLTWMQKLYLGLSRGSIMPEAIRLMQEGISAEVAKELLGRLDSANKYWDQQAGLLIAALSIDAIVPIKLQILEVAWTDWYEQMDKWNSYWNTKQQISSLYLDKQNLSDDDLAVDLQSIIDSQHLKTKLLELEDDAQKVCGTLWQGLETDCEKLSRALGWMQKFHAGLASGSIKHEAIQLLQAGISAGQVRELLGQLESKIKYADQQIEHLTNALSLDISIQFGLQAPQIAWTDWHMQFDKWSNASDKLLRWAQWCNMRRELAATRAEPLVVLIEADALSPDDVVPAYEGNFAEALLGVVFRSSPELRNFVTEVHEGRIKDFCEIDLNLLMLTRQRLARDLWSACPHQMHGATPGSEMGILSGQMQRKRGQKPIRFIIEECGKLLQRIKPCFMMSPMSIAQYIKPGSVDFDVIIFDEASQVKPQDALGAILRGKQLIVMGDSCQLPPTSFFDRVGSDDNDDDELIDDAQTSITDIESILMQCKRAFPTKMLLWHYRSKHESLITVSNQYFYDNRLLVYPSALDKHPDLGLELRHLPDTVYDRGYSATNKLEAEAVVRAIIEHYQQYNWGKPASIPTLGVGTFSTRQQGLIEELLMKAEKYYPELQKYRNREFHEYLFVKNLETIQGDERDVIFISIGYGKDVNGRLHHNFGPLNADGGERRLNVLITRARRKCVVFSNFKAADLKISENAKAGVEALRAFLQYADTRDLLIPDSVGGDFDSPFEEAVYMFLRDQGHQVRKQVGCAGYRIDLGVLHPERLGEYILGVECDGASYHSSLVVRDRDRLREQVLRGLGWRIHRIWSTDWYRSRVESEKRMLMALADARLASDAALEEGELAKAASSTAFEIQRHDPDSVLFEEEQAGMEIAQYVKCNSIEVPPGLKLVDCPSSHLAKLVTKVVKVEAPIHFDDVVTRLRMAWNYGRAGNPIREAISAAIDVAVQNKQVIRRGDFLWKPGQEVVEPRQRNGDTLNIELICKEEIAAALVKVLEYQLATPDDELIKAVARMFGYQAVHNSIALRIKQVLTKQLQARKLIRDSCKMVSLKGSGMR